MILEKKVTSSDAQKILKLLSVENESVSYSGVRSKRFIWGNFIWSSCLSQLASDVYICYVIILHVLCSFMLFSDCYQLQTSCLICEFTKYLRNVCLKCRLLFKVKKFLPALNKIILASVSRRKFIFMVTCYTPWFRTEKNESETIKTLVYVLFGEASSECSLLSALMLLFRMS